jgi:hypothetical protein
MTGLSPQQMSELQQHLRVPDPTELTTQQLLREIATLKELLEARFEGIDKATELRQAHIDRIPGLVAEQVNHLQNIQDEKFRSIAVQFTERDIRTEQTSRDSKVAVDAALQAAKEAVGEQNKSSALAIAKSETGTTKQIDQIGVIINTTTTGLNDKIDDIKTRLTVIDGKAQGVGMSTGLMFSVISCVASFTAIISVIFMIIKHA